MNPDDPRLGQHIRDLSAHFSSRTVPQDGGFDLVIVGFPWDEGVRRNGGRLGSKHGPEHFRARLSRMGAMVNVELGIDLGEIKVGDLGDVTTQPEQPSAHPSLEQAHDELTQRVAFAMSELGAVPFVIGGGNDQSYPNVLALLGRAGDASRVGAINVDAHFDVRPMKEGLHHSGSPFRRLLETGGFLGKNFVEFASQGSQCSAEHARFITQQHGGRILWLNQVQQKGAVQALREVLDNMPDNVFFSFDLDSVRASDAPGVSAPGSVGLSAQDALDMCFEAGRNPKVKLMDLSEYNPIIEGYNTGRLVANMFIYFAMGLVQRKRDAQTKPNAP
jgi:formiminoglutamase